MTLFTEGIGDVVDLDTMPYCGEVEVKLQRNPFMGHIHPESVLHVLS
jgi:hypothetical protein